MFRKNIFPFSLSLIFGTFICCSGAIAQSSLEGVHDERHHDPPLKMDRNQRRLAPPAAVIFGNFQSVQVNIDPSGNNIVGDAANEPSIALNPLDNDNMVIGWRQFDSINSNFRQAG
ncbi:MAG: hypothetical protein AAGA30_02530, partial [Planctomycetota bacterium]